MPEDKNKKLYENLNNKGLYSKTYDDFKEQFSSKEAQSKLYSGLKEKGLYTKSEDDFRNQFFEVKKKDSSGDGLENLPESSEQPTTHSKDKSKDYAANALKRDLELQSNLGQIKQEASVDKFSEYENEKDLVESLQKGREDMDVEPISFQEQFESRLGINKMQEKIKESDDEEVIKRNTDAQIKKNRIARERWKQEHATDQDRLSSAKGSFMQGLTGTLSGIPKSVAIFAKKLDEMTGTGEYDNIPVEQMQSYAFGKWLDDKAKEMFPTNPAYQDDFWTTHVSGGTGSMVGFMTGGLVSNLAKKSAGVARKSLIKKMTGEYVEDKSYETLLSSALKEIPGYNVVKNFDATMAIMGGTSMATPEYEQAYKASLNSGKSEEEAREIAFDTWKYNMMGGSLEAFPLMNFFNKFDKYSNGGVKKMLVSGFTGSLEEATQEMTTQFISNLTAQNMYDDTKGLFDGLKESGEVGGILGFVMNAMGVRLRQYKTSEAIDDKMQVEVDKTLKYVEDQIAKLPASRNEIVTLETEKLRDQNPPKYTINGVGVDGQSLDDIISVAKTKEDLEGISIDNDPVLEKKLVEKFDEVSQEQETLGDNVGIDFRDRLELSRLNERKATLQEQGAEEVEIEIVDEKINEIKQKYEITEEENLPGEKEITTEQEGGKTEDEGVLEAEESVVDNQDLEQQTQQEDAVQEQTTDEVSVQPEATVSEEVETETSKPTVEQTTQEEVEKYVKDEVKTDALKMSKPEWEAKYQQEVKANKNAYEDSRSSAIEQAKTTRQYAQLGTDQGKGRIQPSTIVDDKFTKTLENISKDLSKGLDKRFFVSRRPTKGRASIGSFKPATRTIKIRSHNDLDTLSHEVGHYLDAKYDLLDKAMSNSKIMNEMKDLSQYGSTPPKGVSEEVANEYVAGEGVAEWIRAYMVNPDETLKRYPNFSEVFLNSLDTEALLAIDNTSKDIRSWAALRSVDKIKSNIRFDPNENKGSIIGWLKKGFTDSRRFELTVFDRFSKHFLDETIPFRKAFEWALEKKGQTLEDLKPSQRVDMMARVFLGYRDKIYNILDKGLVDSKYKLLEDKGEAMNIDYLLKPLDKTRLTDDVKGVSAIMVAQRVKEVMDRRIAENQQLEEEGKKPKYSKSQIQNITNIGAGIYNNADVALKAIEEFESMKDSNPERYKALTEAIRRYRTYADKVLRYAVEKGRLSEESYQEIKKNNNQYVAMSRVMDNDVVDWDSEDAPLRFETTSAVGSAKEVIKKFKGSSRMIRNPYESLIENTHKIIQEADRNELMSSFVSEFLDFGDSDVISPVVEVSSQDTGANKVYIDGEKRFFKIDDDIRDVIQNLGENYKLHPAWTFFPKIMRNSITMYPIFALKNRIRDVQHRLVIGESTLKDFWGKKQHEDAYELFGGSQAGFYLKDQDFYYNFLNDKIKELNSDKNTIVISPKSLWDKYEHFIEKGERATRLEEFNGAYKKAKKEGLDEYEANIYAAYKSRDLMDFSVVGQQMKWIRQVIPFSNAAIQGVRKTARTAIENPAKFMMKTAIYSVLPELALRSFYAMGDSDDYKEFLALPVWRKTMFYNIKIGDEWLSIPKPHELSLFGAGAGALFDQYMGDEKAFDDLLPFAAHLVVPFDENVLAGPFVSFIELLANYDFFKRKKIIWGGEEKLAKELRKGEDQSTRLSKLIQDSFGVVNIDVDRRNIDHILKKQFGYYGDLAMRISDIGKEDSRKKFDITSTGLFRHSPVYDNRDVQKVMELATKYNLTRNIYYTKMNELLKDYFEADDEAKDFYVKKMLKVAPEVRRQIEQEVEIIKRTKK